MRQVRSGEFNEYSNAASSYGTDDRGVIASGDRLRIELARLRSENLALKSLLARSHAELIETRMTTRRDKFAKPLNDEDMIGSLRNQLAAAAEALAEANTAFQEATTQAGELTRALAERDELIRRKDLLNQEIDHRVKNSLQDIISLLRIQVDQEPSREAKAFAKLACARLEALSIVHEILHTSKSVNDVDLGAYLDQLCACLRSTLAADGKRRTLILEAEPIILPCEAAQALALAVNELVSNAFRHAFPDGKPGTVWVQLSHRGETALLTVADDGCGVPKGFAMKDQAGLGLRLVTMMTAQLRAKVNIVSRGGTRFTIAVPIPARGTDDMGTPVG